MTRRRVVVRVLEEVDGIFEKVQIGEHVYVRTNEVTPEETNVTKVEGEED